MVYTSFVLQLIDIKRIETRSNLAFDGKVLSSFERISRIRILQDIIDMCLLLTSTKLWYI